MWAHIKPKLIKVVSFSFLKCSDWCVPVRITTLSMFLNSEAWPFRMMVHSFPPYRDIWKGQKKTIGAGQNSSNLVLRSLKTAPLNLYAGTGESWLSPRTRSFGDFESDLHHKSLAGNQLPRQSICWISWRCCSSNWVNTSAGKTGRYPRWQVDSETGSCSFFFWFL